MPLSNSISASEQEAALNLAGMLHTELVSRRELWDKLRCVLQVEAMRQQGSNCLPSLIAQIRKVQGCILEACCRLRPEAALQQQPNVVRQQCEQGVTACCRLRP